MTFIELAGDSLSLTRFALSPLAETLATVTVAHRASVPDPQWAWLHHDEVADGLLSVLTRTKYLPDFVALPPDGMETRWADELARMRRTSDDQARAMLAEARAHGWDDHATSWMQRPRLVERMAEVLDRAWRQVEPDWPRRRAVLERDIRHRAGLVATGGWQRALAGISPKLRWAGQNRIQFSLQHHDGPTLADRGLLLVPHSSGTARWICEDEGTTALVYPARGTLAAAVTPGGTERLIGATRSEILRLAQQPTTPSELALLLGRSLGTVSGHLASLEAAGVVAKVRVGKSVHYSLTQRGTDLLATFS